MNNNETAAAAAGGGAVIGLVVAGPAGAAVGATLGVAAAKTGEWFAGNNAEASQSVSSCDSSSDT